MLEVVQNKRENEMLDAGPLSGVLKRDGSQVAFDSQKIVAAIAKAGMATGEFGNDESELLAGQVLKVLRHRFGGAVVPTVEQIQDVVEQVLISSSLCTLYEQTDVQL